MCRSNIEKLAIERDAFEAYYKPRMWNLEGDSLGYFDHETNAMWRGWQAKALQSSEPVAKPDAWLVPMILDFTDAKKVHFTRSEKGKNLTDDELKAELQGTVIWKAETVFLGDGSPVVDRHGVTHKAKKLFTHPPATVPEGYALVPIKPDSKYLTDVALAIGKLLESVGINTFDINEWCGTYNIAKTAHKAMLSASPTPPNAVPLEKYNKRIAELEAVIKDDAFAVTFQSIAQYRNALLKILRGEQNV